MINKPSIQILTPVFNEEASLPLYVDAVRTVLLEHPEIQFRVLFIEDGSQDNSWRLIQSICAADHRFRGLRLSRNFGSHIAISSGFHNVDADAQAVVVLACDLQDPPETVLRFVQQWQAGAHIVWGKRLSRDDDRWRVLASTLFYRLIRRYAMPKGSRFTTGSFLLADRKVVECVCQFKEQGRIVFAMVAWTGFEQAVVEYHRRVRLTGKSGWNLGGMIKAMYDTVIGYSSMPVRLMTKLGVTLFFLSMLFLTYLVYNWFIGDPLAGWTGLMGTMTLFFGLQFFLVGISGEYLHRIYQESVQRPLYFISDETAASPPPTHERSSAEGDG